VLRRYLTTVLVAAGVVAASACSSNAGNTADRDIRLDFAYYNPLSLVVRDQVCWKTGATTSPGCFRRAVTKPTRALALGGLKAI
jgi:hypothetical protein